MNLKKLLKIATLGVEFSFNSLINSQQEGIVIGTLLSNVGKYIYGLY